MKDNIELLLRARDYCDMVIDEIEKRNQNDEAGRTDIEARRELGYAWKAITKAINLLQLNAVE